LPDADGWELADRLRERLAAPPLVIATAERGDSEAFARSRAAGFAWHFVKPLELPALDHLLHWMLRSRGR
jgi:CheY-like chemotaxis protein